MFEAEVKHDINKNYLIVHGQQEADYMVQMLDGNKIKGFLDMEVREIDNQREYYYDITGKENVSQKTAREKWKYDEVVKLIAGILETVGKAREYMLSEEHFLLEPEYIYRKIDSGEAFLCYAWSQSKNINEQFTQLFSYFLNAVDYEDELAVQLVYKFYDVSREEQCTLQRLWSVFEIVSPEVPKRYMEAEQKETKETAPIESRKNKISKGMLRMEKNEEKSILSGEKKKGKVRKLKPDREENSFLGKLYKVLEKMSGQTEETGVATKEKGLTTKEKKMTAKEKVVANREKSIFAAKKEKMQSVSPDKKDIEKMQFLNGERTQLTKQNQAVSSIAEKNQHQAKKVYRCYLLPEDESQSKISMGEFPFYIGRFQKDTDALKNVVSISRMHCKIEQLEGKYYVSDLHSTNGTYVNQIKLTEGNKKELKAGDELSIADIKYRFSL